MYPFERQLVQGVQKGERHKLEAGVFGIANWITGWRSKGSWLDYWQAKQFILFFRASSKALGPTQHLILRIPSARFLCGKAL
jgi:hypothetical protein